MSSFHVMFTIATQISPVPKSSGIEEFVAEAFKLQCMQTVTGEFVTEVVKERWIQGPNVVVLGVKFYFITDPLHSSPTLKQLLQQCYECYVDFVVWENKNKKKKSEEYFRVNYACFSM